MSAASLPPLKTIGIRAFLVKGATLVGLAMLLERGFFFLANVFSARIAGAEHYGAYTLALQTAGFMASQASLGIGVVATRFASEYPAGHPLHREFIVRIVHLSVFLAIVAAILMLCLAWPLAHWFFNKPLFFRVLFVTIFSAPVFVMLDAVRGLIVGLSYYRGLVILSTLFGCLMLALLPLAAIKGPRWMIFTHAMSAFISCGTLVWLLQQRYRLNLLSRTTNQVSMWPMLRFGMLQLGTGTAVNLVMITLMAMLLRYASKEQLIATALLPLGLVMQHGTLWLINTGLAYYPLFSFREVGYYNAASSVRNISSILPGLLNQTMISLMTNLRGEEFGGANRVLLINTWMTALFLVPVTAVGLIVMPWFLPFFFGNGFVEGVTPACFLLSVALIHMVSQPGVNRLMVLQPRAILLSNLLWIIAALVSAWFFVPQLGSVGVALSLVISHTVAALSVPILLKWYGELPEQLVYLTLLGMLGAIVPLLFIEDQHHPLLHWSNGMILVVATGITFLIWRFREVLRTKP